MVNTITQNLAMKKEISHSFFEIVRNYQVKIENTKNFLDLDKKIQKIFDDWKIQDPLDLGQFILYNVPYFEMFGKKKYLVVPLCYGRRKEYPAKESVVIPGIGFVIVDIETRKTLYKTPLEALRTNIKNGLVDFEKKTGVDMKNEETDQ